MRKFIRLSSANPFHSNNQRTRSKEVCVEIQGNFPAGKVGISGRTTVRNGLQPASLRATKDMTRMHNKLCRLPLRLLLQRWYAAVSTRSACCQRWRHRSLWYVTAHFNFSIPHHESLRQRISGVMLLNLKKHFFSSMTSLTWRTMALLQAYQRERSSLTVPLYHQRECNLNQTKSSKSTLSPFHS